MDTRAQQTAGGNGPTPALSPSRAAAAALSVAIGISVLAHVLLADAQKQASGFPASFVTVTALVTVTATAGAAGIVALCARGDDKRRVVLVATVSSGLAMGACVTGVTYYTVKAADGAAIGLPLIYISLIGAVSAVTLALPADDRVWTCVTFALAVPATVLTFLMAGPDLGLPLRLVAAFIVGGLGIGLAVAVSIPLRALRRR